MIKTNDANKTAWIASCVIALVVTLVGGSWYWSTSTTPEWKADIQLPGLYAALSLGFITPLVFMSSPAVVCVVTIAANTIFYYPLVRLALFVRSKLKADSDSKAA